MTRLLSATLLALAICAKSVAPAHGFNCDPRCRAYRDFASCEKPAIGAKLVLGRITRLFRDGPTPGPIVEMEADANASNEAPGLVEIEIGACTYFTGKAGEQIQVAIDEPRPTTRRYKDHRER